MADADKNILITPNTGVASIEPSIEFTGGDNVTITLNILDDGTLSFEGTSGQLFAISDGAGNTIFSVNDISGVPSIEVDNDGTIRFAELSGNVLIGTAVDNGNLLQVDGSVSTAGNLFVDGTVLKFDGVGLTAIQTSAEGFGNNDTSIMTSAAVEDKILSYSYSTTTGTVTSIDITAGTLIDKTGGPITSSGAITVNVDLSEATEAVYAPGTDYLLFLVGGTAGPAAKEVG